MRVVHILPHLMPGGAERLAVHLMRGLDPSRFQVSAISLGAAAGTDLEQMLAEYRIPTLFLGKGRGFDPRMYSRVLRALNRLRPDVVHTHVHVLRYALPCMLYRPAPVMIHTVHSVAEYEVEPRARFIQRWAYLKGVVPVAVAREVAQSLHRLYGIENARVVPNCIPVSLYARPRVSRERWREQAGFRQDDVLFVCVARFREEKRHDRLLEAFASGPASHPQARLVLVGRGELEENLRQQALQLGISHKVDFLGHHTDIPEVLGAMDVFVLASDYEGNPLSVMEAMAAGLPVIGTAVGGIPELLRNGREGVTVPPANPASLGQAMLYLLENPATRRAMGGAAGRRAREDYDLPVMASAYSELYESLMTRSGYCHV